MQLRGLVAGAILLLPSAVALIAAFTSDRDLAGAAPILRAAPTLVWNSAIVAAAAAVTALVLGVPAGLSLARRPRATALVLTCTPLLLPVYVLTIGWVSGLDLLPRAVQDGTTVLHTRGGAGFVLGVWLFPLIALAVCGAGRGHSRERAESARLLQGRSGEWTVRAVELAPAAGAAATGVFALALLEPTVPYLLRLSNSDLEVQAGQIMLYLGTHRSPLGSLLASLPLALLAVAVGVLVLGGVRRAASSTSPPRPVTREGVPRVAMIVLGVSLAIPLTALAIVAARGGDQAGILFTDLAPIAARSLWIALAATLLALPAATIVGLELTHRPSRLVLAMVILPLALPGGLKGIGLLELLNRPGLDWLYDGPGIVVLGQALQILPILCVLTWGALVRSPRELEQEAAALGASPWARLWRVHLPNALPGLTAAAAAGFLLALAELPTTSLVHPPGQETLAFRTMQLAHYGMSHDLAAAALFLALLSGTAAIAALPILAGIARTGRPAGAGRRADAGRHAGAAGTP